MIKANDKDKKLISIDNAHKGVPYFCPMCNQPLFQRHGKIRQAHFAHYGEKRGFTSCCDKWNYDMSEWHIEWQKRFPEECYEKVLSFEGEKHIADVLINDTVIEFQHSSISFEDFSARNHFYSKCGYKVIWVFDMVELFDDEKIDEYNNCEYSWEYPHKLFREMNFKTIEATIYFQFSNCEDDDSGVMIRVSGGYNRFTEFYGDRNCIFSISEFVDSISEGYQKVIPSKKERPVVPDSVKYGKTINELWKPCFSWMIVRNLVTNQEMIINGDFGHMYHQDNNPRKKIIGKYSHKGLDNRYRYSDYYPVWDDDKAIWSLLKSHCSEEYLEQERLKEEISQTQFNGTALNILVHTTSSNIFYCSYLRKYYLLDFVNGLDSYNVYEFDPQTGEVSENHKNSEVLKLREFPVWEVYNPL